MKKITKISHNLIIPKYQEYFACMRARTADFRDRDQIQGGNRLLVRTKSGSDKGKDPDPQAILV